MAGIWNLLKDSEITLDWEKTKSGPKFRSRTMEIPSSRSKCGTCRHGDEPGMAPTSSLSATMLGQSPALIREEVATKEWMTTWP